MMMACDQSSVVVCCDQGLDWPGNKKLWTCGASWHFSFVLFNFAHPMQNLLISLNTSIPLQANAPEQIYLLPPFSNQRGKINIDSKQLVIDTQGCFAQSDHMNSKKVVSNLLNYQSKRRTQGLQT